MTRRGQVAAAVIGLAVILVIGLAIFFGRAGDQVASSGSSGEPTATAAATPSEASAIPTPRTTPPGTPAPIPSEAIASSASIDLPSAPPNATPTPSPQPGLWRIEGYVVDDDHAPLSGVCVVIGPLGCKPFSPHTDDQGHWFLDIAEGHTAFDFYFEMPGHQTVWWRVIPEGPTEFNVILAKG
jgi:hypothetical protein